MLPKNKLKFDSINAFRSASNQDHLIIYGKQSGKNNNVIIADYYRDVGLQEKFILRSVLSKKQIGRFVKIVRKFKSKDEVI